MDGELSELDWISFYENTREIEETYSRWYGYFFFIIERVIPLKTVKICARDKPLNSFYQCLFHLVSTLVSVRLQILFLYLKVITVNSK